jgi:hypothetical protein
MSLFFNEDAKKTVVYSESLDASTFLQEMVTTQYTEENLEFAKALQEAHNNDYLLSLNEEDRRQLAEQVIAMETRLEELKQICSLQEGFGIISWWKLHAVGSDKALGDKVAKKLSRIKTQEDKDALVSDLQKVKKIAQSLSGTKDQAKGAFWSDLWNAIKSSLATSILSNLAIIPMIIRIVRNNNGTTDDFIKGIDVLIKDAKAVKVSK